jgi:hypothetical protein
MALHDMHLHRLKTGKNFSGRLTMNIDELNAPADCDDGAHVALQFVQIELRAGGERNERERDIFDHC